MTALLGITSRTVVLDMVRSGHYRLVSAGMYPSQVKGFFTPFWILERNIKKAAEA